MGVENASVDCSLVSWGTAYPEISSDGNCSMEPYTGSVCRDQLLAWQECAVGVVEEVLLDGSLMEQSLAERERDTAQFLYFLREFTSDYLKFQFAIVYVSRFEKRGHHFALGCVRKYSPK